MQLKKIIDPVIYLLFCFISLEGCSSDDPGESQLEKSSINDMKKNDQKSPNVTYRILETTPNNFGYQILINNTSYILQKHIPALEGNISFKNKFDAENVAKLVVTKINRGEMPPTVTLHELDSLNVH